MRTAHSVDETLGILPFECRSIERFDGGFGVSSVAASAWRALRSIIFRARQVSGRTWASTSKDGRSGRQATGSAHEFGEALHRAQKMAAVGHMASGIAHDFNNSLQVAMLALALADKRLAQQRSLECQALLRDAHASLQRASTLSHRLLNFARPRQDSAKRTDLNEVIGGMQTLLRSALGGPIALSLALDEHALHVVCDVHDLENAVLNLAINARDAMSSGGRLTISTYRADLLAHGAGLACGPYVGLDIADTGCGMEARVAERAFDAFFTTKSPGQGTGLGLAMVKTFVGEHRGHVDIASVPGRGTTIRIYLPASA